MSSILKGDGTREEFEVEKLIKSLHHAGAEMHIATRVAENVASGIHDGMTTTEIYQNAYKLLRKEERIFAAKYSMRRAILDLGPTGFPFEDYVAELMRAKGYKAKTRVILSGKCADHEVDVVMEKDGRRYGAELKFHNTPGFKTDIKTTLYVSARFLDIGTVATLKGEKSPIDEGWLVTNTKFTENAIQYATCAGVRLLGWDYPRNDALGDWIHETKVYPVTILTTLSKAEKSKLLENGVTLCSMVANDQTLLERAGIPGRKAKGIFSESVGVCAIS